MEDANPKRGSYPPQYYYNSVSNILQTLFDNLTYRTVFRDIFESIGRKKGQWFEKDQFTQFGVRNKSLPAFRKVMAHSGLVYENGLYRQKPCEISNLHQAYFQLFFLGITTEEALDPAFPEKALAIMNYPKSEVSLRYLKQAMLEVRVFMEQIEPSGKVTFERLFYALRRLKSTCIAGQAGSLPSQFKTWFRYHHKLTKNWKEELEQREFRHFIKVNPSDLLGTSRFLTLWLKVDNFASLLKIAKDFPSHQVSIAILFARRINAVFEWIQCPDMFTPKFFNTIWCLIHGSLNPLFRVKSFDDLEIDCDDLTTHQAYIVCDLLLHVAQFEGGFARSSTFKTYTSIPLQDEQYEVLSEIVRDLETFPEIDSK